MRKYNFDGYFVSKKRFWELVDSAKNLNCLREELDIEFKKRAKKKGKKKA